MENPMNLAELGWQRFFESQIPVDDQDSIRAKVCAHRGSHILFLTEAGEISVPIQIVESSVNANVKQARCTSELSKTRSGSAKTGL